MHRYDRSRRQFAIALSGLAGFVDSVGFLSAGGYFVSFMSGNTTRLGVSLGIDPAQALLPVLMICCATIRVRRRDNQDENPVCRDRRRA